ncbi:uncharacterized protein LOC100187406 [Ciona intestinalis]
MYQSKRQQRGNVLIESDTHQGNGYDTRSDEVGKPRTENKRRVAFVGQSRQKPTASKAARKIIADPRDIQEFQQRQRERSTGLAKRPNGRRASIQPVSSSSGQAKNATSQQRVRRASAPARTHDVIQEFSNGEVRMSVVAKKAKNPVQQKPHTDKQHAKNRRVSFHHLVADLSLSTLQEEEEVEDEEEEDDLTSL